MLAPAAPKASALLALCLLPLLLAPAAAQPVALPPLLDIEGGSATVASDMDLPTTVQELCASVTIPAPQLPPGFSQDSVGPLQRVNTTTASWGYHRCARKGRGRRVGGDARIRLNPPAPTRTQSSPPHCACSFGNASSPRPPLVLLPGFGATVDTWRLPLLAALAAGQEVIAVDNRGQGHTIVSRERGCW